MEILLPLLRRGHPISPEDEFLANEHISRFIMLNTLGEARSPYPKTPVTSQESGVPWLDMETLKKANFFWAKDVARARRLARALGGGHAL